MTIEVLISFVDRDSLTGKLTSYAQGDVVSNLSDEVAHAFINEGLAKAYTALGVSGNISITANGQYSVADYAGATVNVPDFKNLVDGSITEVTADMLAGATKIKDYTFYDCKSLESIEIPGSVTSIGENAFFACSNLTSVEIPNGVTEIKTSTFEGCTKLPSITIPSSVTKIRSYAFVTCYLLKNVTVLATTPPTLSSGAFDEPSGDFVIYVPAESVETYQQATGWSSYSSKIQAISE